MNVAVAPLLTIRRGSVYDEIRPVVVDQLHRAVAQHSGDAAELVEQGRLEAVNALLGLGVAPALPEKADDADVALILECSRIADDLATL